MTTQTENLHPNQVDHHQALAGIAVTEASTLILREFLRRSESSAEARIIANVIARSIRTTSSILILCDNQDVQSAWVLHRTLAERLFHLAHLSTTKSYAEFESWSFFEQAKRQTKLVNDPLFRDRTKGPEYHITKEQKVRFTEMLKQPPKWKRARAEDISKQLGVKFVYDYAYDYASMLIHPMANDGEMDLLMSSREDEYSHAKKLVVDNSLLVMSMVLQEAMNSPPLNWAKIAYEMVETVRAYLGDASIDYQTPLRKSEWLLDNETLSGFAAKD